MKKVLLFMLLAITVVYTVPAQHLDQRSVEQSESLKAERKVLQKSKQAPMSAVKIFNSGELQFPVKQISEKIKEDNLKASAADVFPAGSFTATGESYFNGPITWTVTIRKDNTDQTKFWITNFVTPNASNQEIYGTLNGTTLTIPLKQLIRTTATYPTAELVGLSKNGQVISDTGNITATLNETKGTITFSDYGFGSRIYTGATPGSFFELIYAGAVFSDPLKAVPGTVYRQPEGTLFVGMSEDGYSLRGALRAVASPYSTWTWTNLTLTPLTPTYTWKYFSSSNATTELTSTSTDLTFPVENQSFTIPSLKTAFPNGMDSTYIFGANYKYKGEANPGTISAGGGSMTNEGRIFSVTNANPDYGIYPWPFSRGVYVFGTGVNPAGFATDSLISYYDKPQSTLYFEGINVFLGHFSAPAGTEFTMSIMSAKQVSGELQIGNLIAKSTITPENVRVNYQEGDTASVCMQFREFLAVDEDGFETEIDHLELNESFVLVLSGYNKPNVTLAVLSEDIDRPDNENHSYFTYMKNGVSELAQWTQARYTMLFSLYNGYYSYITSTKNTINAAPSGGIYSFTLTPYFNKANLEGTAPTWMQITQNDHFVTGNWGSDITLNVSALPVGIDSREAVLVYKTTGASVSVTVKQSVNSSINTVSVEETYAIREGENFKLSYPVGTTSVSVINTTGQVIESYKLPTNGEFYIPVANLPKGLYMLKFSGKNNATIKIVK